MIDSKLIQVPVLNDICKQLYRVLKSVLMNEKKIALIRDTLRNLEKKKSRIKKIHKLVNRKIDRKFHLDLNELTPSEIDFEMGRRVNNLRENADPRVWINMKSGGNKVLKLILFPIFLIRMIFLKSFSILRDFIFYNNAMLVRLRKTDLRLSELEEKLSSVLDKEMYEECSGTSGE